MLVEYWKVAHYKKKLLKKLPKSGSSPIQFLDVFIKTLLKALFSILTVMADIGHEQ